MEHHCTYVDADTQAECQLPGAVLTTVGSTRDVPGEEGTVSAGMYWFAYLCPEHHKAARASGQVLA